MSDVSLGSIVGERFEIREELGRGGMASVYRVFDKKTTRESALKVLHPEQSMDSAKRQRFKKEFEILHKLSHPGIVEVYEFFDTEESEVFFSMELVQGQSLRTWLKSKLSDDKGISTTISIEEVLRYLETIARVLDFIHEQKLVYSDLKPDNILLRDSFSPGQPTGLPLCLIDFGIAYQVHEDGDPRKMLGTSAYMAPEQIRGEPLDRRADIYAFGILTFELLTGELPFKDDSLFAVSAAHLLGKAPRLTDKNPNVTPGLEQLVHICLEKRKEDRYESMQQVMTRILVLQGTASQSGSLVRKSQAFVSSLFRKSGA